MHDLFLIVGGIIIGLIVAVPIGPVNLICLRRTLAYGVLNGFFSGLGAALGDGLFACITGFGLTAIAQLIEGYATPLRLVGGLMLLGFGLRIFKSDVSLLRSAEGAPVRSEGSATLFGTMASTFALTIANPATLFGFTALFAGLGSLAGGEASFGETALVVAGVIIGSTLWWIMLAATVGIFHRHVDTAVMRKVNHIMGIAVTGFGVVVLSDLAWHFF